MSQWHLPAMGLDAPLDGGGLAIAIIDSGIELDHPDLSGLVERPGCAPGTPIETDHGTSVAGLVAAHLLDGSGLAPLVDDVRLLDIPVYTQVEGELIAGDVAVAAAITCAVAEGASVINLSMASQCSAMPRVQAAVAAADRAGVVVVAAAGNHRGETLVCPAAFDTVIGVAASDQQARPFTSLASADVVAPGRSLLTAGVFPGRPQTTRTGSSYATAIVSGAAVALKHMHPQWSPRRIAAHLHDLSRAAVASGSHLDLSALGLSRPGMHVLSTSGTVHALGDSVPIVGPEFVHRAAVAAARSCSGLWTVDAAGRVQTGGDAPFVGDVRSIALAAPVVAIVATPSGRGYWLAAADGGVFAFGDAGFHGSLGGVNLGSRIVDLVASPTGRGYWLFTSDARVFAFGDAAYQGSIRATISGAANLGDGYALIVDRGVVTLPVAGYVSATGSGRLVGAISSAGELWFVHATGDVRNADGTASLVSPPAVAVARVNRSVDC